MTFVADVVISDGIAILATVCVLVVGLSLFFLAALAINEGYWRVRDGQRARGRTVDLTGRRR